MVRNDPDYHETIIALTEADLARLGRMMLMSVPAAAALGHTMPASSYMYYRSDDPLVQLFADYLAANAVVPIREAADRLAVLTRRLGLAQLGAEFAGTVDSLT